MQQKNNLIESRYASLILWVIFFMFAAGMNFMLPNYGGSGWDMPQNVMVSLFVAVLIAISALKIIHTGTVFISKVQVAVLLFLLCIVIPGLINYEPETQALIPRLIPLVGVFLLFQSVQQLSDTKRVITTILYIICFSGLIQVIYKVSPHYSDYWFFKQFIALTTDFGNRKGAFQQVNMLGTYLATVALISLYLLSKIKIKKKSVVWIANVLFLLASLLGSLYVLFYLMNSSRAALIGFVIGLCLLLIVFWKNISSKKYIIIIFLVLFAAVYIGKSSNISKGVNQAVNAATTLSVDPHESNIDIRVSMWIIASRVYLSSPWVGHGLGNFRTEYTKEQYLYNSSGILAVNKQIYPVAHPHNEVLFLGVESGILAIVGLILLVLFYIFTLFSIGKRHALLWLAFLSPIGFQLFVSFPFYLSTIHLVVFILLMALSTLDRTTQYIFHFSSTIKLTVGMIFLLLLLLYSLFIWNTLKGLLDFGLYRFTKHQHSQLLEAPLESIIWNKKAMVLARNKDFYLDMKNKNEQGILDYIKWLELQVEYNESALLYIHLAQAHLSLGNLLTVRKTLRVIKRRYPVDARSKSVKEIEAFSLRIKKQYQ